MHIPSKRWMVAVSERGQIYRTHIHGEEEKEIRIFLRPHIFTTTSSPPPRKTIRNMRKNVETKRNCTEWLVYELQTKRGYLMQLHTSAKDYFGKGLIREMFTKFQMFCPYCHSNTHTHTEEAQFANARNE